MLSYSKMLKPSFTILLYNLWVNPAIWKNCVFSWRVAVLENGAQIGVFWAERLSPSGCQLCPLTCVRSPCCLGCLGCHQSVPLRETGSFLSHCQRVQRPVGIWDEDKLLLKEETPCWDIFRFMLFYLRSAFPDLWVKKALCRWLEEEGLEGHKKYNDTIMVVQEIELMANILKRFRAVCTFLRLCSAKDLK